MRWFLFFGQILYYISFSNEFATKEKYAKLLGLDFGVTRFHDTQTSTAMCITQYRYLQRNTNLKLPPEPEKYDACPYDKWFEDYKSSSIQKYYNAISTAKAASDKLVDASTVPDGSYYLFLACYTSLGMRNDPTFHFDAESMLQETNNLLIMRRNNAISKIKTWENSGSLSFPSGIVKTIGYNLHTVQDFYSHTNWIEMGQTDVNYNVGINQDLGVPLVSGTSCTPCTRAGMTAAENATYDELANSNYQYVVFKLIPCATGSIKWVFACHNNVVTNGLTTGFYGDDRGIAEKPTNGLKCSHGGGYDSSSLINATGGISKDADTLFFAPHYYLHNQAADVSVEATIQYLEDIRLSINNEQTFGNFLGLHSVSSIAIVLDTTESMRPHRIAVMNGIFKKFKQFAEDHKNDYPPPIFYFTTFDDPIYNYNYFETSELNEMLSYIAVFNDSIFLYDTGGYPPEMCYPALLQLVKKVIQGTSVYVYTDASSKQPELLEEIKDISTQKSISISFIMLGEDAPNIGQCLFLTQTSKADWETEPEIFIYTVCCPVEYKYIYLCREPPFCEHFSDQGYSGSTVCLNSSAYVDKTYEFPPDYVETCSDKSICEITGGDFYCSDKPENNSPTFYNNPTYGNFESSRELRYSSLRDYESLALYTNGFYVSVQNLTDSENIVAGLNVRNNWKLLDAVIFNGHETVSFTFVVDDTIHGLEIRLTSMDMKSIYSLNFKIVYDNGSGAINQAINETFTSNSLRIFDFTSIKSGNWTIQISNAANQIFSVLVQGISALDVSMSMIGDKTFKHLTPGNIYNVFIECPNCKSIDKINVLSCANYSAYFEGSATFISSFNWWYLANVTLSTDITCIKVYGTTLGGQMFSRILDKKASPNSLLIIGSFSLLEMMPNQTNYLSFFIINNGTADQFNITASSSDGAELSFNEDLYNIEANSFINDSIQIVISDDNITSVDLQLIVTSNTNSSVFASATFTIFVLPLNSDLIAPVCNIISDNNTICSTYSEYTVRIEFYDNQTGVASIKYNAGEWDISNFNTIGKGFNNITYTATGTLNCDQNVTTLFSVIDENGLIGRCSFTNIQNVLTTTDFQSHYSDGATTDFRNHYSDARTKLMSHPLYFILISLLISYNINFISIVNI